LRESPGNEYCRFDFLGLGAKLLGYLKLNDGPAQSEIHAPDYVEIEGIYVRKSHCGKGLGRLLLDFAFRQALERRKDYLWLGVWERNVAARLSLKGKERPIDRCLGDNGSVTAVASRAGVHEPERASANRGERWKV
jgi:GNAT superfamily N-acetyltransferase